MRGSTRGKWLLVDEGSGSYTLYERGVTRRQSFHSIVAACRWLRRRHPEAGEYVFESQHGSRKTFRL